MVLEMYLAIPGNANRRYVVERLKCMSNNNFMLRELCQIRSLYYILLISLNCASILRLFFLK